MLPANEGPIGWSFDPAQGVVQGPLDLESFSGKSMMLSLDTDQTALLIEDEKLHAIYLDGTHNLIVGHGFNQISPKASLVFISMASSLQLRWKKDKPVQWSSSDKSGIIGHCDLTITDPVAFYNSFLHDNKSIAEEHALTELDTMVRDVLAELIGNNSLGGGPTTVAELQSRLTCVSAQTLTEELAAQGLTCHQLNLYTMASHMELDATAKARFAPVHY